MDYNSMTHDSNRPQARRKEARLRTQRRHHHQEVAWKAEAGFNEPCVRAIKECTSDSRISFEVNARPREEVARYKAAAVDKIHFNMEVWDR